MISFKNVNIYKENKAIVKANLTIDKGYFKSFTASKNAKTLNNKYIIVPGFIEEHIHGANASDSMYPNDKDIANIARSLTQDGVTSFLPTTMTCKKGDIIKALKNITNHKRGTNEAKILGIHLEGPFINKAYKGAQDEKFILKPNIKDLHDFLLASKNNIRLITIAPELANEAFLKKLKKHHITVSVGHSNAKAMEVEKFLPYLDSITHTYNAQSKFHHRDIGVVGEALLQEKLYAELILDFEHVSKNAAKLLLKNKGKEKLILITDSMEARYKKNGTYKLGTFPVYVKNKRAVLKDGTLAGSILELSKALKNAKSIFNLKTHELVDLVSKNVKNNLKLDKVGSIKIGNYADFVIIDKDFNVYQTYVNGQCVYTKKGFRF